MCPCVAASVFAFVFCLPVFFFTVWALLSFVGFFDGGDFFLEFLLIDFLEKFVSFCAEEVIEVVEGSTVVGGVHDEVAFGEQGIEFVVEQIVNGARIGGERHQSTSL